MKELTREETMQLADRITHPALVPSQFINKYKWTNLQRHPYSVLSTEEAAEIEDGIQNLIKQMKEAVGNPSVDTMNQVLNLKQIRKSACASPAVLTRMYRGVAKKGDVEGLRKRFEEIVLHMEE